MRFEQRFNRFARKYHPDNFSGSEPEKQQRAELIYRRGTEAYRVLLDSQKRVVYDKGLEAGHKRYSAEWVEKVQKERPRGGQVIVSSPKARTFYASARRAIASQDWSQAKLNLKMTLQHDPDNEGLKEALDKVQEEMTKK